jgi:hypothetical protein
MLISRNQHGSSPVPTQRRAAWAAGRVGTAPLRGIWGRLGRAPPWGPVNVNAGHQRSSEVIRGHQRSSEVIRGNRRSSEAVGDHQRSSEVIRGHQRSSGVIRGHEIAHLQPASERSCADRGWVECRVCHLHAMREAISMQSGRQSACNQGGNQHAMREADRRWVECRVCHLHALREAISMH